MDTIISELSLNLHIIIHRKEECKRVYSKKYDISSTEKALIIEQGRHTMIRSGTVTGTRDIQVKPATKRTEVAGGLFKIALNIRVAAYGRVSTLEESQQSSYATQCSYYTELINSKPEWTFAGMYADEGISGTSRKNRKQFNAMMEAAQNGEFDYIITKCISRFARNTVDTLSCVRKLKELDPPVGVYFEKENIDSLDSKGELVLTILAGIAQEESRSISTNIRWSIERLFKQGIPIVNLTRMLGYDKGPDGDWVINEDQAKTVRYIFESYASGKCATKIAKELNTIGRLTVTNSSWTGGSVLDTLRNEKYVGDVEMQKTITLNYLSHKAVKNTGQAPRYYCHDHHIGIIDRFTWDKVQARLEGMHSREPKVRKKKSPFINIVCGCCGAPFKRTAYTTDLSNYTDDRSLAAEGVPEGLYSEKYYFNYPVWRCEEKYRRREKNGRMSEEEREACESRCSSPLLHEVAIKQSFMEMLYRLKREYEELGDESGFVKEFKEAFKVVYEDSLAKNGGKSYNRQRLALLEQEIKTLEAQKEEALENRVEAIAEEAAAMCDAKEMGVEYEPPAESAADLYSKLVSDIQHKIDALYREKESMEGDQETAVTMKENFDFFLECILALPEKNGAGMKMNVMGLDVKETVFTGEDGRSNGETLGRYHGGSFHITEEHMRNAPDLLNFDESIYRIFFPSAVAEGDSMRFISNFGVGFRASGVTRSLRAFLGYRCTTEDGCIECITEKWQPYNAAVCYKRREYKKHKKEQNV